MPTWLWHGTADQDVPVAAARRMAQAIPTCRATFTDEGHLMGLRHADEAIEAIRTATGARADLAPASPSSLPPRPAGHGTASDHFCNGLVQEGAEAARATGPTVLRDPIRSPLTDDRRNWQRRRWRCFTMTHNEEAARLAEASDNSGAQA